MRQYTYVKAIGNNILHCGYDINGKKFVEKENFLPSLYLESADGQHIGLYGDMLDKREYPIKEWRKFIRDQKDYLNIHGTIEPEYQFIAENYPDDVPNIKIKTLYIDIEVLSQFEFPRPQEAAYPIVSIAMKDSEADQFYVFGLNHFDVHKSKYNVIYKQFGTEEELLQAFITVVRKMKPDIMCGWNSEGFDYPYIINRCGQVLGEEETKKMSFIGKVSTTFMEGKGKNGMDTWRNNIEGIALLDYLDLYKKFTMSDEESYSLDFIAKKVLGAGKIEHTDESLYELYHRDFQKFIEYNIRDVDILEQFENVLGFIANTVAIAYTAKVNIADALGTVKLWDVLVYNHLKKRGIVIPPLKVEAGAVDYAGGYVKEPIAGMYENIIYMDLTSLYPHVIMQYNISPETKIKDFRESVSITQVDGRFFRREIELKQGYTLAPSGVYFRKDVKGVFPELMQELFVTRNDIKNQMKVEKKAGNKELANSLNLKQNAMKVILNGGYGAMANAYFRYFDIELATSITLGAQLSTRWIEHAVENNAQLNKKYNVIYIDTDSCVLGYKGEVQGNEEERVKFLIDLAQNELEPFIEQQYDDLAQYMGCNENKMIMKLEKIALRGIWFKKKRYALLDWYDEGANPRPPKLGVTGLEIVRSSTPSAFKPFMKETLNLLLESPDKVKDYIESTVGKFDDLPVEEIAFPRGISDIDKYYQKEGFKSGTPIHVRGAMLYNRYVGDSVDNIHNGNKIKFVYMKKPNPIQNENVFGFPKKMPEELQKYVDRKMQVDKGYLSVVKEWCRVAGIEVDKKTVDVDDIF